MRSLAVAPLFLWALIQRGAPAAGELSSFENLDAATGLEEDDRYHGQQDQRAQSVDSKFQALAQLCVDSCYDDFIQWVSRLRLSLLR
jgi:hypothetical protein